MAVTQIKDGFAGGSDNQMKVNADGSINVDVTGGGGTTNTNLTQVGGAPIALGQTTESASLPVTIASDQSAIPVTGTVVVSDPSVGSTGVTAPTSATEMGAVDSMGKLQPLTVDPAGKLLVDISGSSTVTGTVNANILGLNVFQTSQYTIGTSAVQLTPTPLTNRSSMSIKATCTGANAVYIGNSNAVTTSTGYPVFNGDVLNLDITPTGAVWAISAATNQTAYILELAD